MMKIDYSLRPYQEKFVTTTLEKFRKFSKLLGVAPTGSGKTIMFAKIAESFAPAKTLILAHRNELVRQAKDKLYKSTGIEAQIEKGKHYASLDAGVVVSSVQTLLSDKRLKRWPRDHFGLVVVDEAHHVLAKSWLKILVHFDPWAKVLGVTATPDRGDKRNLGEYFEDVAYEISLRELIEQQYLARIFVKTVPIKIDLSSASKRFGDYRDEDLSHIIEPYLCEIVSKLPELIGNRKTLVFLPLVRTSEKFAKLCRSVGLKANHIGGDITESEQLQIIEDFRRDEFQILCNSQLLSEGYDEPSISCVICLRPTKSRSLYVQMIGRGTRTHPNKENLLLLDFLWLSDKHDIVKPTDLIKSKTELNQDSIDLPETDGRYDNIADSAMKDAVESKLASELAKNANRQELVFDPLQYDFCFESVDLEYWEPTKPWHEEPPSKAQLTTLAKYGFKPESIGCKGFAAAILTKIIERRNKNLATPKQIHWLIKTGHEDPFNATFEQATNWLNNQFIIRR